MDPARLVSTVGLYLLLLAGAAHTAERGTSQDPESSPESLPTYVKLAYRPDNPVSMLDLPKDFMAVQLLAVSSKGALEDYVRTEGLQGVSAARVAQGGNLRYVLLLGIYENRELAQEAIKDMPPAMNEMNAWIRPVVSLQQAIIGGDDLAGELGR